MNHNQNKKTLRHFQCRDFLWEIFEQMSAELECSVDYLINEAMRQYARARNYSPQGMGLSGGDLMGTTGAMTRPTSAPPPARITTTGQGRHMMTPRPAPPPPIPGAPRPRPPQPIPPGGQVPGALPPRSYVGPTSEGPAYAPEGSSYGASDPQAFAKPAMVSPQPPLAGVTSGPPGGRLFLIFNGRKIPITKDQFIIGRGSKTSDLPIKDGNISRKHAAIINHSGVYYIKDLGSTNGIEYNGMRIDNKRVEEGDVFHICDYEIRFTYR